MKRLALLTALLLALWPATALAYLDPASGSMILQVILGGAAGLVVAVRLFWRRIAARFSRTPSQDEPSGD